MTSLAEAARALPSTPSKPRTIGLAIEVGEEQLLLMSMVTGLVSVPITLNGDQLVLIPGAGFGYLVNGMDPLSAPLYVPLQLAVRIRSLGIELRLRHYFAVPAVLSSGVLTAVIGGSVPLWDRSQNVITLGVDFGSAIFWQSQGPPAFTFTVGPALGFVHTW